MATKQEQLGEAHRKSFLRGGERTAGGSRAGVAAMWKSRCRSAFARTGGVRDPRPDRGSARGCADQSRRAEAARRAGAPAPPGERGRLPRPADRGAVGRAGSADRGPLARQLRVAPAHAARERPDRAPPAGLPPARRAGRARRASASRRCSSRDAPRSQSATRNRERRPCIRRSASGEAPHWRTCSSSPSPAPKPSGSRRGGSSRSRPGSTPISRSARAASSPGSSNGSSRRTRCASASSAS